MNNSNSPINDTVYRNLYRKLALKENNYRKNQLKKQLNKSEEWRIVQATENMKVIHKRWAGIVDEPWKRSVDFEIDLSLRLPGTSNANDIFATIAGMEERHKQLLLPNIDR
jgi:hypothetical protein